MERTKGKRGRKAYTLEERIIGVEICERVQEVREKNGMSQGAFADKLGLGHATICDWETQDKVPMLIPLVRVCKTFGVSLDWLVFGKETDNEKV